MRRPLVFEVVPVASVVHRVRAEVKIVGLVALSLAVALAPGWAALAVGALSVLAIAIAARLPRSVVPSPPRWLAAPLLSAGTFSLLAGGDPTVGGVGVGGLVDLGRIFAVGLLLAAWALLVAWTTPLTDVAAGFVRLLRPLRRFGPVADLATVLAITIRCVPLLGGELRTVLDARRTRPPTPASARRRVFADLTDVGAVVVVGAHRRAGELALAMAARGSTTAPVPERLPVTATDIVAAAALATVAVVMVLVG